MVEINKKKCAYSCHGLAIPPPHYGGVACQ